MAKQYRRGAATAAVAVALPAAAILLSNIVRGAGLVETLQSEPLGLLAGAGAVLLLRGSGEREVSSGAKRITGSALALLLMTAAALHWVLAFAKAPVPHALPGLWAFCFSLLAATLLCKPRFPRTGVGLDICIGFLGLLIVLMHAVGLQTAAHGRPQYSFFTGLALLVLAGAWLAAYPRRRPVAFFVESGSASLILRRVLPTTFIFPVLLVAMSALGQHFKVLGQLLNWIGLGVVVVYGAWLFWMIAESLDRMDTVRLTAEHELRASGERYRKLFEQNPQPMWLIDVETLRIIGVNEGACRLYGFNREEFLQLNVMDLRHGGRPDEIRQQFVRSDTEGSSLHRHFTKDGRQLEVEIFSHRTDWEGRPVWVSYGHDLTAHLAALSQLRDSEAQVRVLLESASEAIFAVNAAGEIVWCNPATLRLTGWSASRQLLGRSTHQAFHHSNPDGTPMPEEVCALAQAARRGRSFAGELTLWRADGSGFPAECRCSPLAQEGRTEGAVITFTDVTERNQLNAQFQQAQKMEAVGRLAAGIAHDFNNLLTVINGYAEMLTRRPDAPDAGKRISHILTAGQRAAELTRQLLAFSRQQILQPKLLDLQEAMEELGPLMRRLLGEDLELHIALASGLGRVRADPGQISQVLMNLVVNARDAIPEGGHITIEAANVELDANYAAAHPEVEPGPYVMLAVSDTGTGMDAQTIAHAFEPFYTTKPKGKGTGLGLSMVFGVVKQSGGSIAIYSELGHGTTIKVYLPRQDVSEEPSSAGSGDDAASMGQERVLVIEDEDSVRELVREVLEDKGYQVSVASHPAEALALQETLETLDLMISDVVMPGMDGRRLAAELCQLRPGLRVLFISGYPDKAVSKNGNLEPGLAFIQKPFTSEALARKVREVLDADPKRAQGMAGCL